MSKAASRRSSRIKTIAIVAVVLMTVYLVALLLWASQKTVVSEILQNGELETSINTEAVIVRDESTIKSPMTGSYIPNFEDGDKISANACIATIFNSSSDSLLKQIKAKELSIMKALQKKSVGLNYFSKDIGKIDADVEEEVSGLISAINDNNISQSSSIQKEINTMMQKKAEIIVGQTTSDPKINKLKSDMDNLKTFLTANRKLAYSGSSGIISYSVDGYEEVLKPNKISSFSPDFIEDISANVSTKSVAQEANSNKPLAKVLKNFKYYIVASNETKKMKIFSQGESVRVRINDLGEIISANVYYISKDYAGKTIIALVTDKRISETVNMRKINIDIIKDHYSGYAVPLSALKNIDNKKKTAIIVLVKFNTAIFTEVKIVAKNSNMAIIEDTEGTVLGSGINLYDTFITNPINIKDGQEVTK